MPDDGGDRPCETCDGTGCPACGDTGDERTRRLLDQNGPDRASRPAGIVRTCGGCGRAFYEDLVAPTAERGRCPRCRGPRPVPEDRVAALTELAHARRTEASVWQGRYEMAEQDVDRLANLVTQIKRGDFDGQTGVLINVCNAELDRLSSEPRPVPALDPETEALHEFAAEQERERHALAVRVRKAEDLLREVAQSGVSFDDARVGYVEVQIDRSEWAAITAYLSAEGTGDR